jgi:hypothetical protein
MRAYLIPRVVDLLKPISHHSFAFDQLKSEKTETSDEAPPPSTRLGVIRYEAWRLPSADEGSKGFINLAVVLDWTGYGGSISKIDSQISEWEDSL